MASTANEVLEHAASLIEEVGWTRGDYARSEDGFPVSYKSPSAACFCIGGAVRRAGEDLSASWVAVWRALSKINGYSIGRYGTVYPFANDEIIDSAAEAAAALRAAVYLGER